MNELKGTVGLAFLRNHWSVESRILVRRVKLSHYSSSVDIVLVCKVDVNVGHKKMTSVIAEMQNRIMRVKTFIDKDQPENHWCSVAAYLVLNYPSKLAHNFSFACKEKQKDFLRRPVTETDDEAVSW